MGKKRLYRESWTPILYCYGIAIMIFIFTIMLPKSDHKIISIHELDEEIASHARVVHGDSSGSRHHPSGETKNKSCDCQSPDRDEIHAQVRDFLFGGEELKIKADMANSVDAGGKDTEDATGDDVAGDDEDVDEDLIGKEAQPDVPASATKLVRPSCYHWYKGKKKLIESHKVPLEGVGKVMPILTMFTTLKNLQHRRIIHENTIRNWAKLAPYVIPVLYNDSTDPELIKIAKETGWRVHPVPAYGSTGVPRLKDMYKFAKDNYNSSFYGYSNGDIMYDDGLMQTLHAVKNMLPKFERALVIGTRYNVKLDGMKISDPPEVAKLMRRIGKISSWAIDFFLIANCDYPWHRVPDEIVIGRPGYDNFIVGVANQYKVPVIDVSCTVAAIHQMGPEGRSAGFKNKDRGVNKRLIGKFNWGLGLLQRATFETGYTEDGNNDVISVIQRTQYKNIPKF